MSCLADGRNESFKGFCFKKIKSKNLNFQKNEDNSGVLNFYYMVAFLNEFYIYYLK